MHIFRKIKPLRDFLYLKRQKQTSIGFVPTMGALHHGHVALIQASKSENAITVCSIYINPTQFDNSKDLENYPSTELMDIALLEEIQCDVLFIPNHTEMYTTFGNTFQFTFGHFGEIMEGQFRPKHFNGVALVISKFFNIVQPNFAYFGQKDYQQFKIISLLIEGLKFPITLRNIPTVRDSTGLALSSRNQRLTDHEKQCAQSFFIMLNFAKKAIEQGEHFSHKRKAIQNLFDNMKIVKLDYFELVDCKNLELIDHLDLHYQAILLIAGYVGKVRLIDNIMVFNNKNKEKI